MSIPSRVTRRRAGAFLLRPMCFVHTIIQYSLVLLCFVELSWQQKDPLNDFCRRFGHQSAIIDSRLYIDGGLVNWNPISQNPLNYTNTFLSYNELSLVGDGGQPQLNANLSKNGTIPNLVGGILWPDNVNKRFYLFGGEYYQTPPMNFKMLSYDILSNDWNSFGPPSDPINSSSWGAGVAISERGEGYYYGGWVSSVTTPGWIGSPVAMSTMIKYDMDSNQWTTSMGPDSIPRAEGVMVYLPASDQGLLIYFGGISQPYQNVTVEGSPMSKIFVYDIASSQWYVQTASGDVPEMRRRFCAGATWAPDRSSYNIYLYGGAGMAPNTTGFDDVYILTLPSFIWIKWFPSSPGIGNPHNSLTCNIVNGAQMLVIGGTFPLTDMCDAPNVWGTHSLDLGKQNPDGAMWFSYRSNLTSYVVPEEIISEVGGSSLGGATVTAPATWLNRDLPIYFTRNATNAVRTPTRAVTTSSTPMSTNSTSPSPSPSSPILSTGAIVGITLASVAVLILISLTIFYIFHRRRRRTPIYNAQEANSSSCPHTIATLDDLPSNASSDLPINPHYHAPPSWPPLLSLPRLQISRHESPGDVNLPSPPYASSISQPHSPLQQVQHERHVIAEPKYDYASSMALKTGSLPAEPNPPSPRQQERYQHQARVYGLWPAQSQPQQHGSLPSLSPPSSAGPVSDSGYI